MPAESGPRSASWASISPSRAPSRSSTSGDFANSPTIPHIGLEELEVAVELPRRDLLVRGLHLAALAGDEVVEVVAVARRAERTPDDVVALELARRVEQVLRQRPDAELLALPGARLVEVERVRVARVELALDPVEPGGEQDGRRQVGVAGAIDRPVLDPARRGDPQHLRAVVVGVGDVHRRPGGARARVADLEPLVRVDG